MSQPDELTRELRGALALDEGERAYLARIDLAASWRTRRANATDSHLGWLALFGVLAAFLVWSVAAQPVGQVLSTASNLGASTVLLTSALGAVLYTSESLIHLATNPALSLTQPLLALLALALLLLPRLSSATNSLQGVRS